MFPSENLTILRGRRQVVGRDETCDTTLPGTEISRQHAEFRVDGPIVALRDLESRNGVFVNGVRSTDVPVQPGDVIRCGEWIGIVGAGGHAVGLREIAPGWFGGATLEAAVEPARRVAADLPIVVQGETGTGKEGAVRAIHGWSDRHGPFVAVNCSALPAHLAEAELFGHRKGAFTGAHDASPGLVRAAHGGTLFLDEVLELDAAVQAKLLRVLEQREVMALGETRSVAVDIRVIVATQEPLARAVAERRFRADLYARLDGVTVVLPPLRGRREDILPLFCTFLRQYGGEQLPDLEPKLVEALAVYDWPLNVRELVLLVRRLLAVHRKDPLLRRTHLPERMRTPAQQAQGAGDGARGARKRAWRKADDRAEYEALVAALREQEGSVARAAAAVGVSRARAYRVLSAHPDSGTGGGNP